MLSTNKWDSCPEDGGGTNIFETAWHHNPQVFTPNVHCHEQLKSEFYSFKLCKVHAQLLMRIH